MKNECGGCGNEIDPDTCHCGSAVNSHNWGDCHSPVPMGCECSYPDAIRCQFCEKMSRRGDWKEDHCPKCGGKYDAMLAQEGDD